MGIFLNRGWFARCAACKLVVSLAGLMAGLIVAHAANAAAIQCERNIRASVVALEQAIVLNRFGAFNPAGMMLSLQRDRVFSGPASIADGTSVTEANPHVTVAQDATAGEHRPSNKGLTRAPNSFCGDSP
ncbi:MAG: hypothetical protein ABI589_06890 [Burkholderiales bacterium]